MFKLISLHMGPINATHSHPKKMNWHNPKFDTHAIVIYGWVKIKNMMLSKTIKLRAIDQRVGLSNRDEILYASKFIQIFQSPTSSMIGLALNGPNKCVLTYGAQDWWILVKCFHKSELFLNIST